MKDAPETGPNRSGTRYSAADKLKAVKLYFEEGYQAKDIARELGIGKSSLGKWIREYREKGSGLRIHDFYLSLVVKKKVA